MKKKFYGMLALGAIALGAVGVSIAATGLTPKADDPVNYMAKAMGNGQGSADTPTDFGWESTNANQSWGIAYTGGSYTNGYRDDLGGKRGLVMVQTTAVWSFPVTGLQEGKVYKFNCELSYINHADAVEKVAFASQRDGGGTVYASKQLTVAKWGDTSSVELKFFVPENNATTYFCWSTTNNKDRALLFDPTLYEDPDASIVTFVNNNDSDNSYVIADNGSALEQPSNPSKPGFTFDGWYTDEACTTAYDFSTVVSGNLTLYAKWVEAAPVTPEPPYVYAAGEKVVVDGLEYELTGTNVITNGDFSKGLEGWYTGADKDTPLSTENFEVLSTGGPNDGTYLHPLGHTGNNGVASVATEWELTPGKTYYFSFWGKNTHEWWKFGLAETATSGSDAISLGNNADWTQFQYIFKATEDAHYLAFNPRWLGEDHNAGMAYFNLFEASEGTPAELLPVAPNMLYNASFLDDAAVWIPAADAVGVDADVKDGVLTVVSNGQDAIYYQNMTLKEGKSYTFGVEYKGSYEGTKAFCGFWNPDAKHTPGNYNDVPAAEDWTLSTSSYTPGNLNKSIVLATNGGATAQYRNPWVIENPTITLSATSLAAGESVKATLSNSEYFTMKYSVNGGEEKAYNGEEITAEEAGQISFYAYYAYAEGKEVKVANSNITVLSEDDAKNLMYGAILSHDALTTPSAPWLAYNTANDQFGDGNGWQFRAESGGMSDGGQARQLFLRWNDGDSKWVYAYELNLDANTCYEFTCDATTNDGKDNSLLLGVTTDMANAKDLETSAFVLNGVDSDKLWTNPVKVDYTFVTKEAGKYYLVFKTSNLGGNIIIRIANVNLVSVDLDKALAAAKEEANKLLEDNDYSCVSGSERTDLKEALNTKTTSEEEKIAALETLTDAIAAFRAAQSDYKAYQDVYSQYPRIKSTYPDAGSFALNALEVYTPLNAKEAAQFAADGMQAIRNVIESNALAEGVNGNNPIQGVIENPVPYDNNTNGWAQEAYNGGTQGKIRVQSNERLTQTNGFEVTHYFDSDNWGDNNWGVDFNQTIDVAPGKYRLSVFCRGSENMKEYLLYANNETAKMTHAGSKGNWFGNGWDIVYVDFTVPEGAQTRAAMESATIGVKAKAESGSNWISFTDFRIVQIGDVESGVSTIEAAEEAEAGVIYDLNGRMVKGDNLNKGIYIRVANGKATKFIVR